MVRLLERRGSLLRFPRRTLRLGAGFAALRDMADTHPDRLPVRQVYALLTGDEDARACKEIPDEACQEQPANFFLHLLSSLTSKTADELASANLVLAWLLGAVAAPTSLVGLLVPIRESGALLPQIAIAGYLRRLPVRKWLWVAGSVLQGLAAAGMALATIAFEGRAAGWSIVGLLVILSLARGICSVAHKDVLGKTIDRARRGTVTGYAGALAGLVTIVVGLYLTAARPAGTPALALLLVAAALLWFVAGGIFAALREQPGATEGGANALREAVRSISLLRSDRAFRRFVFTRALLLATALSLPFYVALAVQRTGTSAAGLGQFLLASGIAAAVSAPAWGRFADRSARMTMIAAALIAAVLGGAVFVLVALDSPWLAEQKVFAALFLVLSLAHTGVRIGRKTYLVDLATADTRAAYVAVSNSLIGLLLLGSATIALVAEQLGTAAVIALLALAALGGAISALRLPEAER